MKHFFLVNHLREALILSASFLLFFTACREEGELVPSFQDSVVESNFTDSILIRTTTRIGDSIPADRVATGLVGIYRDSSFGEVTSSLHIQPVLPSNALLFFEEGRERFEIDSVVLALAYTDYFGDTTVPQTISVLRIDEVLSIQSTYFSDTNIAVVPSPIGTKTFSPAPNTGGTVLLPNLTGGVDTTVVDAQLRIRLDNSIGEEIINKSGLPEVSDNENFTQFFNGLKIEPVNTNNQNNNEAAILHFGINSSNTNLTVFYRTIDETSGLVTNRSVIFPVNSSSVRFNTFQHNYSNSAVIDVLNGVTVNPTEAYTQAMAGVETVIEFPNLLTELEEDILINKAELVLPVASGSYAEFGVAPSITAAIRDNNGNLQFVPDASESLEFFGGTFDEADNSYSFTISRYIQGVLNGSILDNGLTILVAGSAINAERAVFLNENNTGRQIKLNLYYTNIN